MLLTATMAPHTGAVTPQSQSTPLQHNLENHNDSLAPPVAYALVPPRRNSFTTAVTQTSNSE